MSIHDGDDTKKNGVWVCPKFMLNFPSSSAVTSLSLLTPDAKRPPVVVLGTITGEVHFVQCAHKRVPQMEIATQLKTSSAVTAIAVGPLTGGPHGNDIVCISADGFLQCMVPPTDAHVNTVFTQMIQSNISSACIFDVNKDNEAELVVAMTDRVVRTFRFDRGGKARRLLPLAKWEVPHQISAFAIGEHASSVRGTGIEMWLSQMNSRYYICVPFSSQEPSLETLATKERNVMIVPYRSSHIHINGTLISNILVMAHQKERMLYNPGWDLCAASTLRVNKSLNVVVTIDLRGTICIYGYNERNIKESEVCPLVRIDAVRNATRLSACCDPTSLYIAVADASGSIMVLEVAISTILQQLNH